MGSRLGRLLDIAYNIEYGAETWEQSSLNLIYLLAYIGPGQLRIFGPSNEKYHVRGGNDQIPARLTQALAGQIETGMRLTKLARQTDGTWALAFNGGAANVTADRIVLALPFSILRGSVDLSEAGFSALKMTAIQELGMGQNAKFHMQFRRRWWNELGGTGESYSETGYQSSWEVTRAQPGAPGILVNYTGGSTAVSASGSTLAGILSQFEPVMPGLTAQSNSKSQLQYWPGNPLTLGSYSCWKVGQYTKFAGVEGERAGTCRFAGEHTSIDSQGYLNGAVESGERVAAEILSDFK
jgi:monoamine oxidase